MKKILILNGPNLNMLGIREPEIYGDKTIRDLEDLCIEVGHRHDFLVDFRQSNHEGELVEWIQEARGIHDGIIINAAAYTHTSIAIHDALKLIKAPIVEVHLSDPKKREEFRHFSYIEPLAAAVLQGMGHRDMKWLWISLQKYCHKKTDALTFGPKFCMQVAGIRNEFY